MSYTAEVTENSGIQRNILHIDFDKATIEGELTVFWFKDHGYIINYIPALNLSSYGDTPEEARAMMIDVVINDFCEQLMKLSKVAIAEELSKLGWVIAGMDIGNFENSAYIDQNGVLQNFSLPEDTQIQQEVLTVV